MKNVFQLMSFLCWFVNEFTFGGKIKIRLLYHIEPTVAWTLCNASIMFLCNSELKNFNYCPKLIIQQYYKRIKRNHRRRESIKKNIFNLCVWFIDMWLLLHFAYCESSRKRLSEFIFRWYIFLSGCVYPYDVHFVFATAQPFSFMKCITFYARKN